MNIPLLIERSLVMPLLEITQICPINRVIRLDESTAELIDLYSANLHVSADGFLKKALTYVFLRHHEFQRFLRIIESRPAAERRRKRRRPQNGTGHGVAPEPLQRVSELAKDLETGSAERPHG
jgi:hypothetical protein